MGGSDQFLTLEGNMALPLSEPVTIIADEAHISVLRERLDRSWVADAKPIPLPLDDALPLSEIPDKGIAVVHVDPLVPVSMGRIATMRRDRPHVSLIVALETTDLRLVRTLVREGVADVVGIPIEPEELYQAIVALNEARLSAVGVGTELAPLVAVTRTLGGTGATTVASHMAYEVARSGREVCVLDLDFQFGRMAEVFGLSPRRNLSDLLEASQRVDGALLRSVAASRGGGVSVVAPPSELLPLESFDQEALWRIITVARQEYDVVFIEMPVGLTNSTLSILSRADRIILVVRQTLESLRQSRRVCDLFVRLGLDPRLLSIVVNHVEKRRFGSINLGDVEQALGRSFASAVPVDAATVASAQDQGLLAPELKPRSPFALELRDFASDFLDSLDAEGR